jgi:putative mycofactocin binding protein MftB
LVPPWVRVRREDFGLLFYDTRSTRLTFVRSGDRLEAPPFTGADRLLRVRTGAELAGDAAAEPMSEADAPLATDGRALSQLLEDLVVKGLIVADEAE